MGALVMIVPYYLYIKSKEFSMKITLGDTRWGLMPPYLHNDRSRRPEGRPAAASIPFFSETELAPPWLEEPDGSSRV
jgi:hypothetical protein